MGFPKTFTKRQRRRVQRWIAINTVFAEMLLAYERGGGDVAHAMLADVVAGVTEAMNVWCKKHGSGLRFGAQVSSREV